MYKLQDIDIISYVKNRLIEQGDKSMDDDYSCRYRGYRQSTMDEIREHADEIASENNDQSSDIYQDIYIDALNSILADTKHDAKCAIGHLISDSVYYTGIEGAGVDEDIFELVIQSNPAWEKGPKAYGLIKRLQDIHDHHSVEEWKKSFDSLMQQCDENGNWTGGN